MCARHLPNPVAILLAASLASQVSVVATAQNTRFSDRGNRDEGVITTHEISGGYFSLSGLQIETDTDVVADAEELEVTFWLPEPERLSVKVWLPETNYWMVPHRRDFETGEQRFRWPVADVIKPLGVNPTRLQVLIANEDQTLYFPGLLHDGSQNLAERRYVFWFVSRVGAFLQASIMRMTNDGSVLVYKTTVNEEYGGKVPIRWDGRDASGEIAPSGIYHLRLEGEIELATRYDTLAMHVPFVHYVPAN